MSARSLIAIIKYKGNKVKKNFLRAMLCVVLIGFSADARAWLPGVVPAIDVVTSVLAVMLLVGHCEQSAKLDELKKSQAALEGLYRRGIAINAVCSACVAAAVLGAGCLYARYCSDKKDQGESVPGQKDSRSTEL